MLEKLYRDPQTLGKSRQAANDTIPWEGFDWEDLPKELVKERDNFVVEGFDSEDKKKGLRGKGPKAQSG